MPRFTKADNEPEQTFESIRDKYQTLFDQKNTEKRSYLELVEIAKKRRTEAMEEAEKAYKNANIEEYHKLQDQIRFDDDEIKMYSDKANAIDKEPYITRAEFDEICRVIEKDFDKYVESDREKLTNIVKSMITIRDREYKRLIESNKFLKFAQLTLLKATNGLWRDGMLESFKVKELKNYEGLDFVRFVCSHNFVESYLKK